MPAPVVSVVMSVFDCERFLSEAIDSILNQTFEDFEFIIYIQALRLNPQLLSSQFVKKFIRGIRKRNAST